MKRHPDWQKRLTEYLQKSAGEGFKFGRMDGAIFASGAIKAMTGEDLMKGLRGYRTAKGGIKKLKAAGYDDHVAFAEAHMAETDTPQAGDLAIIEGEDGPCFGICQGRSVYVITEREGLVTVANSRIDRAFSV